MISRLLKFWFLVVLLLVFSACGRNTPETSIIPTHPTASPPLAVTATARQTLTPLPILTSSPKIALTSKLNSISMPGLFVDQLALDDASIYWKAQSGIELFRFAITASKVTDAVSIAKSRFTGGLLSIYPYQSLARAGDWLIFDDRAISGQTELWSLRAFNLKTQTEEEIAKGEQPDILYTFSSDGEWIVWMTSDLSTDRITAQNLQTGQRKELTHSYSASNGWEDLVASAGRAIAIQRGDNGRSLVLFDLESGQSRVLLTDTTGAMNNFAFYGDWIAWKTETNSYGPTALYNLKTAQTEILPDWGVAPLLVGHWLTWEAAFEQPLYAVDLENRQIYRVADAQSGDNLSSVTIDGNTIAWCRTHSDPANTKIDSTVEWRTLP